MSLAHKRSREWISQGPTWCPRSEESKLLLSWLHHHGFCSQHYLMALEGCWGSSLVTSTPQTAGRQLGKRGKGDREGACQLFNKDVCEKGTYILSDFIFIFSKNTWPHLEQRGGLEMYARKKAPAKNWGLFITGMEGMDVGGQLTICHTRQNRPSVTSCCGPWVQETETPPGGQVPKFQDPGWKNRLQKSWIFKFNCDQQKSYAPEREAPFEKALLPRRHTFSVASRTRVCAIPKRLSWR